MALEKIADLINVVNEIVDLLIKMVFAFIYLGGAVLKLVVAIVLIYMLRGWKSKKI